MFDLVRKVGFHQGEHFAETPHVIVEFFRRRRGGSYFHPRSVKAGQNRTGKHDHRQNKQRAPSSGHAESVLLMRSIAYLLIQTCKPVVWLRHFSAYRVQNTVDKLHRFLA